MMALIFVAALIASFALRSARAQGGDQKNPAPAAAGAPAATIRTAERNVQAPDGQFKVRLRQSPADPREGEQVQFAADLSEQVEGGFANAGPQPIESRDSHRASDNRRRWSGCDWAADACRRSRLLRSSLRLPQWW